LQHNTALESVFTWRQSSYILSKVLTQKSHKKRYFMIQKVCAVHSPVMAVPRRWRKFTPPTTHLNYWEGCQILQTIP